MQAWYLLKSHPSCGFVDAEDLDGEAIGMHVMRMTRWGGMRLHGGNERLCHTATERVAGGWSVADLRCDIALT